MTLEEMRARRKELIDKTRNIRSIANQENRELSDEEARVVNESLERSEHLSKEIKTEERLGAQEDLALESHRDAIRPDVGAGSTPPGQPKFFRSFGEQLQAVYRAAQPGAKLDSRLEQRAVSGMSEGVPADGGFLVQTDFATELIKRVYSTGAVAARCRQIAIGPNSNGVTINAINETSRADGSRWGGVKVYWTAEAGDKTATQPEFRQIELKLKKLTGLAYATDELLQDSSALESVLMQAFAEEFAFRLDDAIIRGAGGGQPMGILNAGCLVTQAIEGGQLADTIVAENLVNIWSRLWVGSRQNAVWFINQSIEPQLYTMGLAVGLGGVSVYMPPGGFSASPYGSIFGRPVIAIEQTDTLGDLGDIILADMSQYLLATKGGIQSASSIHVRFVNDETTFRFVYRVDGQPAWASALTPFNTAPTVSPFVTLAAR